MTKPNNPWNPLPVEPKGDDDVTTLYAAVGQALSAWELMESGLGYAFTLLCRAEFEGAARSYGVVSSFSGRRDMLVEAFSCYPHRADSRLAGFVKFLDRVKEFSARRNEIAHGLAVPFQDNGHSIGWYLVPALYNSRKRLSHSHLLAAVLDNGGAWHSALKYAYTSSQLDYYKQQFGELGTEAGQFLTALSALAMQDFKDRYGGVEGDGGSGV